MNRKGKGASRGIENSERQDTTQRRKRNSKKAAKSCKKARAEAA